MLLDFIRHGEPVGGRRYRGQIDDVLSEKGWAQMRATVGSAPPWQRIVASPLARCRAFAEALAREQNVPLSFEPRLMEVGFGEWEGHSAAEIETRWPGALAAFKRDPIGARPAGAEPLADFAARVAAGLDDLVAHYAGQHVLVVCHAGVIRMAFAWALQLPLASAYRVEVASAALTRFKIGGFKLGGFKLGDPGNALVFHDGRLP